MNYPFYLFTFTVICLISHTTVAEHPTRHTENKNITNKLEQMYVWGQSLSSNDTGYTSPTSLLLEQDMVSINAVTTEDLVKFEPSLVIRRRFIGDSNGTMGVRGSNMFQTSRSSVFADGVPLHYLLQSRWNGAPRWTMVSASEIEKVEVLYGPFSAQYGGNSMGGVVLIETNIPQEREFTANITAFTQNFSAYDFKDDLHGFKGFVSFGDKIGDLSYYLSLNHLDNNAQPQTFRGASTASTDTASTATGGEFGLDSRARNQYFYGDTGVVDTTTNNYKFKLGYDFGQWQTLLNVALEDRASDNTGNSYISDLNQVTLFSANDAVVSGQRFSFNSRRINQNSLERESLSLGIRLKGKLNTYTSVEANINQFDIKKDERLATSAHPQSAAFDNTGQITDFDDSGWQTADIKFTFEPFFKDNISLIIGARHENYELNLNVFNSLNINEKTKDSFASLFGGKTKLNALYTELNWDINHKLDASLGIRYENFSSSDGYFSDDNTNTAEFDLVQVPGTKTSKTSPKLTMGYDFQTDWQVRYSIAKAFRFPITEELFSQFRAFNVINESNPELKPEDGLHHNILLERNLSAGYVRFNFFQETINDAIESQSTTIVGGINDGTSVRTFVPLDKTRARGVEFIYNQYNALINNFDVRFNLTYTDAKILENTADVSLVGNIYPRMPRWRSNLLATYHISEKWDIGTNIQYASNAFGRIQNDDFINNVFGAQDAYTRIGLKSTYQLTDNIKTSFGVDNLLNDIDYVAHPWPGRTLYVTFGLTL